MKKIVLVTGANRGIGKEIARQMAAMGHIVYAGTRNAENAPKITEELGENVKGVPLDITQAHEIAAVTAKIMEEQGVLDVLINNAGVMDSHIGISQTDMETIRTVLETNYFGAIQVSQACIPLLAKSREGRIINVSSSMGIWSDLDGRYAGYRLSKVGLNAVTVMFANDLKNQNIRVNSMCPGWVQTDMGGINAPRTLAQGADTAVWLATEKQIPTGKFFRDRKEIKFW